MHDTDTLREPEPAGRCDALGFAALLAGAALLLAACGGGSATVPAPQPDPDPAPAADPDPEPEPEPAPKYDPVHGPYDPSRGRFEVKIERNSFENIDEVFALGTTAERYEMNYYPERGTGGGDGPPIVSLEDGKIYLTDTCCVGVKVEVEKGTHVRETERRRVSDGNVYFGARETIATGARIEREGQDDFVTFGWWYRVQGQQFMDSAPDHGKPWSTQIRAFADGPEFRRVPETFPTGLAEYEGPSIGLHTIEKGGNRATKEFSGIARFGVSYSGGETLSPVVGNISIDGERIFSVGRGNIYPKTGRFETPVLSLENPDLPFLDSPSTLIGEISSILEGGFPRAMIGSFVVRGVDKDPDIKGVEITHRETYIGAFHSALHNTPTRR